RDWRDLEHMQTGALGWCVEVAGRRRHRSLDGAQPVVVFAAVEAPALGGLPVEAFELAAWSRPKVHPDCHVKVGRALYSVPWRLIGRHVDAREADRTVEVFDNGTLVKTWARIERGRQTDYADYPPEKVAFFMRNPTWCRRRASELGPAVVEVINELLADNALHRLRSAQGVLGLATTHSPQRLDAACRRAVEVGDPTYRTIKGILAAGTETTTIETPATPDAPAHLHGPARLFAIDSDKGVAS
ncbi:MAG: Mu transposase domain-containing protein, partial [Desertimonas sp.]